MKLDKINQKIITTLQQDARITNLMLADAVGLSESACLARVRKLEKEKLITRYCAELNLQAFQHVRFIVNIALSHQDAKFNEPFKKAIAKMPEIVDCYKVSGEYDYIVNFVCRDAAHFNYVSEAMLQQNLGIEKMNSQLIIEETKSHQGYPVMLLLEEKN